MFSHPTSHPTRALCFLGVRDADAVYKPPQVGYALTISAMDAPRVKHMHAPRAQHHTTEDGPPAKRGVPKVVEIDEQRPYGYS